MIATGIQKQAMFIEEKDCQKGASARGCWPVWLGLIEKSTKKVEMRAMDLIRNGKKEIPGYLSLTPNPCHYPVAVSHRI